MLLFEKIIIGIVVFVLLCAITVILFVRVSNPAISPFPQEELLVPYGF